MFYCLHNSFICLLVYLLVEYSDYLELRHLLGGRRLLERTAYFGMDTQQCSAYRGPCLFGAPRLLEGCGRLQDTCKYILLTCERVYIWAVSGAEIQGREGWRVLPSISGSVLRHSVKCCQAYLLLWLKSRGPGEGSRHLQPRAGCLRGALVSMWNSALREGFNFYFQGVFC